MILLEALFLVTAIAKCGAFTAPPASSSASLKSTICDQTERMSATISVLSDPNSDERDEKRGPSPDEGFVQLRNEIRANENSELYQRCVRVACTRVDGVRVGIIVACHGTD